MGTTSTRLEQTLTASTDRLHSMRSVRTTSTFITPVDPEGRELASHKAELHLEPVVRRGAEDGSQIYL